MPINPSIIEFQTYLNQLLEVDSETMSKLFQIRVECNQRLADHPTVQVMLGKEKQEYLVGFLGILNGFFGSFDLGPRAGWGALQMVVEQDGSISTFTVDDGV